MTFRYLGRDFSQNRPRDLGFAGEDAADVQGGALFFGDGVGDVEFVTGVGRAAEAVGLEVDALLDAVPVFIGGGAGVTFPWT